MKIFRRNSLIAGALLAVLTGALPGPAFAQAPSSTADRKKYDAAVALFHKAKALESEELAEKKREAIAAYMSAAEIFRSVGSRSDEANTLNAAAIVHEDLRETGTAIDLYVRVAAILDSLNDKANLALTLTNIGGLWNQLGLFRKSIEYLERALPIRLELGDRAGEALTLAFMGKAYDGLGEKEKAIETLNRSMAIRRALKDTEGEAISLGDLGIVYLSLGEIDKALGHLTRSLELARSLTDKTAEAAALHNIASVYDNIGNTALAVENYDRSLEIARRAGDLKGAAATLNNLGALYLDRGENVKARDHFVQAAVLRMSVGDVSGVLATSINIGYLLALMGDRKGALESFDQALPLARALGDRHAEASTLHNIGYTHELAGQRATAIEFYNQALPLRRYVGDKAGEARTLANMMLDWDALANPRLAALYGKQAINRFQELRSSIRSMELGVRKLYLASIEDTYRDLAEILIAQGRIAEAEQVLGMLKEEEVFVFQRRDDKVARELLQTSTLTESERAAIVGYEKLAEQITAIAGEYGELDRQRLEYPEGKFPKQARLDELARLRSDAIIAFQKYLEQLKIEFAKSGKDREVAQVDSSLQETLREMKAERTAVVSTIAGEKRLNIIVTTPDVQRAHTVDISEAALNKLVGDFRRALTSPATGNPVDPRPAGQKLYDILVKPIEGDLAGIKADTIIWSLDGSLRYLPMAALWDRQKGYLAERYANAVITLASRDRLLLPPSLRKDRTALGAGVSAATEGFSALDAVPDELDCIVTDPVTKTVSSKPVCAAGVLPGQKLLDDKFSETAFRAAIGRYSILHLASHFKLVPGSDNDSFLLLGGGEDRRFTMNKLNTLSMTGVELLALSACNTATPGGSKENGVEIEGFGAVAQKRGARSVMATLWPVADPSTRDFMVEFYRRFGTATVPKAEAIREAQLKLMRGSYAASEGIKPPRAETFSSGAQTVGPPFEIDKRAPYAHPYYWAPFILFGNWQ